MGTSLWAFVPLVPLFTVATTSQANTSLPAGHVDGSQPLEGGHLAVWTFFSGVKNFMLIAEGSLSLLEDGHLAVDTSNVSHAILESQTGVPPNVSLVSGYFVLWYKSFFDISSNIRFCLVNDAKPFDSFLARDRLVQFVEKALGLSRLHVF